MPSARHRVLCFLFFEEKCHVSQVLLWIGVCSCFLFLKEKCHVSQVLLWIDACFCRGLDRSCFHGPCSRRLGRPVGF